MKKFVSMFVMVAFLSIYAVAFAYTPSEWVTNSGLKTSSELLYTGAGFLYGVTAGTDGTNAAQIDLFDALTAVEGTQLLPTWVVTTSSTDRMQSTPWYYPPIPFNTGLYLRITCSGTVSVNVYYKGK